MICDIYVETTYKGPRRQTGLLAFVIVARYENQPDHTDKLYCHQKAPITMQEALLRCTAAALDRAANMARLRSVKEFNIISTNPWVGNMFNNLDTWKANGWKNSKGEEVKYKDYWQMIDKAGEGRTIRWINEEERGSGLDSYRDWLLRTIRMK